jgi:hypothetical protein
MAKSADASDMHFFKSQNSRAAVVRSTCAKILRLLRQLFEFFTPAIAAQSLSTEGRWG